MIKFLSVIICIAIAIFFIFGLLIAFEYFKYLKRKFVLFLRSKLKK